MDVSLYEKFSLKTQRLVSEAERESQRQIVSTSILIITKHKTTYEIFRVFLGRQSYELSFTL